MFSYFNNTSIDLLGTNQFSKYVNNCFFAFLGTLGAVTLTAMFKDFELFCACSITTFAILHCLMLNFVVRYLMHYSLTLKKIATNCFWPLDMADDATFSKINRSYKLGRRVAFFNQLLIFLICCYCSFSKNNCNTTLLRQFFDDYFGEPVSFFLLFAYQTCMLYGSIILSCPASIAIYGSLHIISQVRLLNSYISKKMDEMQPDNADFQNAIERDLILCIKQHQNISKFMKIFAIFCSRLQTTSCAGATPVVAFCAYCYLLHANTVINIETGQSYGVFAAFIHACLAVIYYGQLVSDEVTNFRKNLMLCRWYLWNNKNRKLFLMLNMAANYFDRPINLWGSNNMDYTIIISIIQFFFSVFTFLKKVTPSE